MKKGYWENSLSCLFVEATGKMPVLPVLHEGVVEFFKLSVKS